MFTLFTQRLKLKFLSTENQQFSLVFERTNDENIVHTLNFVPKHTIPIDCHSRSHAKQQMAKFVAQTYFISSRRMIDANSPMKVEVCRVNSNSMWYCRKYTHSHGHRAKRTNISIVLTANNMNNQRIVYASKTIWARMRGKSYSNHSIFPGNRFPSSNIHVQCKASEQYRCRQLLRVT